VISKRVLIGFILSPLIATIVFWGISYLVSLQYEKPPLDVPASFIQYLLGFLITITLTSFVAYGFAVVVGLPIFFFLTKRQMDSLSHYLVLGLITGTAPMLLSFLMYRTFFIYDLARTIAGGVMGAAFFWYFAIRKEGRSV